MSIDAYIPLKAMFGRRAIEIRPAFVLPRSIDEIRDVLAKAQPDYDEVELALTTELQVKIPGFPYWRSADLVDGNTLHFSMGSGSHFARFLRWYCDTCDIDIKVIH